MHGLISIGLITEPAYKYNEHQHSNWEIIYYVYGTGILRVGNREFRFQPGDIICQPPGIPHSETSEEGFRNIHLSIETFNNPGHNIPCYHDTAGRDFYHLLVQLHKEHHIRRKNWIKITEGLLDVLYQYMVSWDADNKRNPYVENLENILISNISTKNLRVNELMKQIPMSEDHLRKLFRNETGKTPLEYLNEKRIDYAKQLLDNSLKASAAIKEVAGMAGFDDPYYFSRLFKKITGRSPTGWSRG